MRPGSNGAALLRFGFSFAFRLVFWCVLVPALFLFVAFLSLAVFVLILMLAGLAVTA